MPDVPPPIRPWPLFRSFSGATSASLARDVIAGLTLAAIAVPEQMATARLGGFAPQLGFIAFMAAGVGFAVFGSSRQLSAGADSTITPIFAGSLALMAVAGSPQYLALAAVLAVLVGVLLVVAGIFKLGWIADLLSVPVIEVHLSNPQARESYRHHSYVAMAATGSITGVGPFGYLLAIDAVAELLKGKKGSSK